MDKTTITLSSDEIEDIRFCLARVAQENEDTAAGDNIPAIRLRVLTEQADRFRRLAVKVTDQTDPRD
jgi:hypothetical protein